MDAKSRGGGGRGQWLRPHGAEGGRCLWTSQVTPQPRLLCGHARPEWGGLAADGFLGPLSCICGWELGAVSGGVDRPNATSWEASILSKSQGLGVVLTYYPVPRAHSPVKS